MKIKLSNIKEALTNKVDVFICSSSFEERCLSISRAIAPYASSSKIVFYVDDLNENINDNINDNADKLYSILGDDSCCVPIKINNPAKSLISMSSALDDVLLENKQQNFIIDITTFTHEGLLILFKLIRHKIKENDKIFMCYNGAKDYSYNEPIPEKKWLSKGVKSVRSILGYPGLSDPSMKNHLIVLFGFERERTKRLIDIFEYDLVSLAFGSRETSIAHEHQKINELRHDELLELYPNAKKFEISLIDPLQTQSQILEHVKSFPGYNTVIAPMNNKISSIGAALAAIGQPEIQLCYVTANQYNFEGYSQASEDGYCLEVK